jgi:ABC-type multidrug transport system fused ATPase/permease subunit
VLAFALITLTTGFTLWQNGAVGLGGVLLPTVITLSSFGPTLALSSLSGGLQSTLASGRRVLELLDETPETEEITVGLRPTFTGAESRELTFSYGGQSVLRDLSLTLEPGKITGIAGKSGAGKSTFLKLLMRFWNAPDNSLFVSEASVDMIETAHLRTLEAYMTQETDIFHATIAENIAMGKPDATMKEIIAASKKAALHKFVLTLPQGYDTPVGELGSTLSGGQRQRIGLARAFLGGAPLLLLDEPTSSLDSLNEGAILKALREECTQSGRTVVLVSHRASTLGSADKVIQFSASQ